MWSHSLSCTLKTLLLSLLILTIPDHTNAQQEKNNIYLFDCTGSMQTAGLWQHAKEALDATISTQTSIKGSSFTIIPFGDRPYQSIEFSDNGYDKNKEAIASAFDKWIKEANYTRISDVLTEAIGKCNPYKENKIYLLTDGQPNGGDTPDKVADIIARWCADHRNTRLFYVALREGILPEAVRSAIDECPDAYIVQCHNNVIPQIGDISSEIHANIEELSTVHTLGFSLPGTYPLSVSCSDSLFTVSIQGDKATGGKIPVVIRPRDNASPEVLHRRITSVCGSNTPYTFTVTINIPDENYFIANPEVSIAMADHIQTRLSLAGGENEIDLGSSSWYGPFLWSPASSPAQIETDLAPQFVNLSGQPVSLSLILQPADGSTRDFRLYYNGKEIPADASFTVTPDTDSHLKIVFDPDATTGKRYFTLLPIDSHGIDIINGQPTDDFEGLTLRTSYTTVWNPLKTTLTWAAIILLALLLIWLFILRRRVFPLIKVAAIEFTGPDSYFLKKRIKGARKVVLTSHQRKQGLISRLFTGPVLYVKAEHFSPEIEITPLGSRKKIRMRPLNGFDDAWDITPTTMLEPYDKGTITHRTNKCRINFDIL